MSQRVCANCGSEITDDPEELILFCDRMCTNEYLFEHDDVPEEPHYA